MDNPNLSLIRYIKSEGRADGSKVSLSRIFQSDAHNRFNFSVEDIWNLLNTGLAYIDFHDDRRLLDIKYWKLCLTDLGNQFLDNPDISPYDPEGMLNYIKSNIQNLDDVIEFYLKESLETFNKRCYLSSVFTLGAASEKAILILREKYCDRLNTDDYACFDRYPYDSKSTYKIKLDTEEGIKHIFSAIYKDINTINKVDSNYFGSDLMEKIILQLREVFNNIRISRNEVGHPQKINIVKYNAYAKLVSFPEYLITVYEIMGIFDSKTLPAGLTF